MRLITLALHVRVLEQERLASRKSNPKKNAAPSRAAAPTGLAYAARSCRLRTSSAFWAGHPPRRSRWWRCRPRGSGTWHRTATLPRTVVEACLVLKFALAEYGLPSDVQAVGVQVNNETPVVTITRRSANSDGSFNGHAILVVPPARRMIDATVQQIFAEVAQTPTATLPLVAQLPAGDRLASETFGVVRQEYTVAYRPYPEPDRAESGDRCPDRPFPARWRGPRGQRLRPDEDACLP